MARWRTLPPAIALAVSAVARAGGLYVPGGDAALRADLQLLVDERVLRLPVQAWPLSRPALIAALADSGEPGWEDPELRFAYERVRRAVDDSDELQVSADTTVGNPGLARDFATAGREEGTLRVQAAARDEHWGVVGSLSAVTSAADQQTLRGDGSELTARAGDWLFGLNTLDRWWGPGTQGSLILSNNARPVPALMLERAGDGQSMAAGMFGPWRVSALAGVLDSGHGTAARPWLLALRAEAMPTPWLDVALARSTTPGRAVNAVDARAVSPWRELPAAAYLQLAVPDEAGRRSAAGLAGLEYWRDINDGDYWRINLEYADTACTPARADCLYDGEGSDERGYRFLQRSLGHWADGAARLGSINLGYARAQADLWSLKLLGGQLRQRDADATQALAMAPAPGRYRAVELGWQGLLQQRPVRLQLGWQGMAGGGGPAQPGWYGFIGWHQNL